MTQTAESEGRERVELCEFIANPSVQSDQTKSFLAVGRPRTLGSQLAS